MNLLKQTRLPTVNLPAAIRRKMWLSPFIKSYLVVFFAYLAMYLIRKNFNVAQNDLISTYGFTKTQLGTIGVAFSITRASDGLPKPAFSSCCAFSALCLVCEAYHGHNGSIQGQSDL